MIKNYLVLYILLFISEIAFTQTSNIYLPLDYEWSYVKGTRSYTGNPGNKYWQNNSDYNIDVALEPKTRLLTGKAKIKYYNNSPDSLNIIVFKLYQDLYKKGNARGKNIDSKDLHDGTIIEKLNINGISVDIGSPIIKRDGTNMIIILSKPLEPNNKLEIGIDWNFTLPKYTNIRMGTVDSSTFFVAYWFPQIAVYDDISQWELFNYDGFHEFYNDFSNFDINISVPNNYIVWSTGTLENYKELFEEKYLKRFEISMLSDTVVHIVREEDLNKKIVKTKTQINTWHYKANNVTDFAFGLSNHYLWDATSLITDKENNKRTTVNAAYKKNSKYHIESAALSQRAIKYLSEDFPKIPYPYPQMTIFEGFGGMEFPMITNMKPCSNRPEFVFVVSHEIAHNYFPFFVGTNQLKYSWMDEGWAMLLPVKFQDIEETGNYSPKNAVEYFSWYGATEMNTPLMTPSVYLMGYEAAISSYYKPELAFNFLRDMLGEETFNKTLKEYVSRWKGKHPTPYDLFFTFEDVTKKSLSWYWKAWFFEPGYPDLAIKNVVISEGKVTFTIEKQGNIPVPVNIKFIYTDGTEEKNYHSVEIWKDKDILKEEKLFKNKELKKIIIGSKEIPDAKANNNIFER